jgi:hypothetical protein
MGSVLGQGGLWEGSGRALLGAKIWPSAGPGAVRWCQRLGITGPGLGWAERRPRVGGLGMPFEYECGRPGCRRPDDGLSPAGTVARDFFILASMCCKWPMYVLWRYARP